MNSHADVRAVTTSFAELAGISPGDVVYALAPLFHITGAVVIGALALTERTSLVFTGRFTTDVAVDALHEDGVTYTIGSITAFNTLMNSEYATAEHFSTIRTLYSGGAPVPPSTVARFPYRVEPTLVEPAPDQIRRERRTRIDHRGRDLEGAGADPLDPDRGHDCGDGLLGDLLTGLTQISGNPRGAVGAVRNGVCVPNQCRVIAADAAQEHRAPVTAPGPWPIPSEALTMH